VIRYRADWILPVDVRPLRDGWVAIDNGRVAAIGEGHALSVDRDLGRVAVLPGLVNAHTHLELSHLRGQVPPAAEFVEWIRGVMAARRQHPDPMAAEILDGVRAGIDEAVRCGTVLVGDISNTLVSFEPLVSSQLGGVLFFEVIRFTAPDPVAVVRQALDLIDARGASAAVRCSLAAHAPYSVAPSVFRAIREALRPRGAPPCSVHLCEGREEIQFVDSGEGPWRTVLETLGSWDPAWTPPGTGPVRYLDDLGFLDTNVLAVHGVQMTGEDLERLRVRGVTLVTCPRSNRHTGAGSPPLGHFFGSGVGVAIGTDSLSSAPDLNLFNELAAARTLAPRVPASRLLESATVIGARALGFAEEFGTIQPGRSGRLLAVRIPEGVGDVEEYLVSGVEPERLFWLDDRGGSR
jgi:cytosine/adenosine deaminase-related metal-dependent hydrolase